MDFRCRPKVTKIQNNTDVTYKNALFDYESKKRIHFSFFSSFNNEHDFNALNLFNFRNLSLTNTWFEPD